MPSYWRWTTVGDISSVTGGLTQNSKRDGLPVQLPYLRVANVYANELRLDQVFEIGVQEGELPRVLLEQGDLLVVEGNGSLDQIGRVAVWSGAIEPCLHQNHLIKIRFVPAAIGRFALYWLISSAGRGQITRVASSTSGLHTLSISKVQALKLPLAPLFEQQRIVEAIESYFTRLDDAVATLQRVERNLKRYRASVLKSAVEGRLVPTEAALARQEGRDYEPASVLLERILTERRRRWSESGKKGKYQEPTPPDTTNLPDLPEGWCWATMPQLGELNRGKSKHRPRNDPRLLNGPYPFIQTGDVRHSECYIETYENTYSDFGLAQSRLWPAGTLCITIAANIAETGILKFSACFPDSVVGFLQENQTLTRYVELFLRTARERLNQYAPATAQKNINLQVLSEVAVPLPPVAEQERIVNNIDQYMSVARHIEGGVGTGAVRSARLRQSILKWAFE
ncbi:MAG: restriction endonuclease subunit S, partial [Nitrospira sp.]|nr:restriction endonuclease subunit S [Nitrospira sp.]